MNKSKPKVYCMISGGVDSSVAAALLVREGYEVTGVFMKNWSPGTLQSLTDCPWEQDQKDAEAVCQKLKIPFRSVNFEKEYRQKVVDYFLKEYRTGRTPNPDVMCNREIKFGIFLAWAVSEGADLVASGHYVRLVRTGRDLSLHRGIDANKDQSYFLWTLSRDQLEKCLFPIGNLEKSEVRKIATDLGLPTAQKKDSQGICFIGAINVGQFLRSEISAKTGKVIGLDGKIWGTHDGAIYYTIGQRHGFRLNDSVGRTFPSKQIPPLYVVVKDLEKNLIYVGLKDDKRLLSSELVIGEVNWLNDKFDRQNLSAQIRYRQKAVHCSINHTRCGLAASRTDLPHRGCKVVFQEPVWAASLGQSLVIYDRDKVIVGGIIEKIF